MGFINSLTVGKKAEDYAIQYFEKRGMKYIDVRSNQEYQKKDVDFMVGNISYEIKQNYHNARYYHPGLYIWIELEVGKNHGWWYFCEADYYIFFNGEGSGLLIENNNKFKDRINNLMENGDHSRYGLNRFDYVWDDRGYGYIKVKVMRIYMEQIEDLITNKIVRRRQK